MTSHLLCKLIVVGSLLSTAPALAWQTLIGNDSSRTDQTFSFGIKAHYAQPANQLILVGAQNAQEGKEYALSKISLNDYKVTACATQTAMVDTQYDQPNPLYNAAISHIVCPNATYAVVTIESEPSTLYAINHYATEKEVLSCVLKDQQGIICDRISLVETNGDNLVFAALTTADKKCGIALISYSEKTEKVKIAPDEFKKLENEIQECQDDEKKRNRLRKGIATEQDGTYYRNVVTKQFAQEPNTILLPEYVKEVTALSWHSGTGCLYMGITYHQPINHQKCSILVGMLRADKTMDFKPVTHACLNIFMDGYIEDLVPFNTTTGALDYLIVKNGKTAQKLYCFALCNQRILESRKTFAEQGMLADQNAKPLAIFEGTRNKFLGRQLINTYVPNSDAPELAPYDIGAGYLYAGPISHIMVRSDVIFALVSQPFVGFSAGIYQSQALYDNLGRIAGWTLWQKTADYEGLDFAFINSAKNNLLFFEQDLEGEKGTRKVQVNQWPEIARDEIAQLIKVAQKEFVDCAYEIKKIVDLNLLTPGIHSKNITFLLGDEKMVVAQMPDFAAVAFEQKDFASIGNPTCVQIGISDEQGWLFVGGTNGLIKLVDATDCGWPMPRGLYSVTELQGMRAQPVGNYSMVRKLLFDNGFLYVLTDSCLDRIDLRNSAITRLADIQQLCKQRYSIFYDVIISDKCALLATSAGLYRVGNGKNCMCDDYSTIDWTIVQIPEATDLPLFLSPVSISGNPHDWAKGAGQIYIITGSHTKKGAHIHRFAVKDVQDHEITDETILPIADWVYKDRMSDIGSLLVCSDCFATDGASYLAPFRQKKSKAMILYNGLTKARTTINLDLHVEDTISCITRNSSYGNWLVAGSFGLKTNI